MCVTTERRPRVSLTRRPPALAPNPFRYTGMTEETFKAMRRVMPVHRNKVSWNINEARLNANLTSGK